MHDLMSDQVLYVHIICDFLLFGQLFVCLLQHIMLITFVCYLHQDQIKATDYQRKQEALCVD